MPKQYKPNDKNQSKKNQNKKDDPNKVNKKLVDWAVKVAKVEFEKGNGPGVAANKAWAGIQNKYDKTADEIRNRLVRLFNAN